MKKNLIKGISFTVGASLWWGIIGVIYFKFVSYASPLELTIHRTIWTALLLVITTSYYKKWSEFRKIINVIVIIVSGLVALFGFNYIPYKAYVIVAALTGLVAAFVLTKYKKKL